MTVEAFAALLPAYLLRALDDLERRTVVLEYTIYSLSPNDEEDGDNEWTRRALERLRDRAAALTPAQIEAVRGFLTFVAANAADREWLVRCITAALDQVWHAPST